MVDPKACGEPAAGAWGGIMFHKCVADGKKLSLWISVSEWGTRSFFLFIFYFFNLFFIYALIDEDEDDN